MSTPNPIRFGLAGVGNVGTTHVKRFQDGLIPGAKLVALADTNPQALARFPDVKGWPDAAALIRSGEIDALIIATPHFSHTTIGIDALQHGLHVLCEKPLSVHKADCARLLAAHQDLRQIFAVMFDARTEPRYQQLRELVRSGQLGRIRRINWILTAWYRPNAYYRSSDWRATWGGEGGGMLVNQLPHDLDLFQWIFGMPKRVKAFCPTGKYHPIEAEDEVNALFEFEDGATGVLVATTGEAPGTDRREIIGDNGRVLVHADRLEFTRTVVPVSEFTRTATGSFTSPESEEIILPVTGQGGRHTEVINRFVAAIRDGTPLIAAAAEGVASVELANAITLSAHLDRTIELPLDADVFEKWLAGKRAASSYVPGKSG